MHTLECSGQHEWGGLLSHSIGKVDPFRCLTHLCGHGYTRKPCFNFHIAWHMTRLCSIWLVSHGVFLDVTVRVRVTTMIYHYIIMMSYSCRLHPETTIACDPPLQLSSNISPAIRHVCSNIVKQVPMGVYTSLYYSVITALTSPLQLQTWPGLKAAWLVLQCWCHWWDEDYSNFNLWEPCVILFVPQKP